MLTSNFLAGESAHSDELPRFAYFPLRCEDHRAEPHASALDVLLAWTERPDYVAVSITGEFGTGKSTTCLLFAQRLLKKLAGRRDAVFPIYVPVNRAALAEQPESFLERLLVSEYGLGDITALTASRNICLILDGLEAPEDYFGNPVAQAAGSMRISQRRLIVHSARRYPRPSELPSAALAAASGLRFDACIRVLPMDARDQRRYMEEVHGAGNPNSARAQHVLESLTAVQAQLDRPLLLELAMLVPRPKDGRLPTSLTALFDLAINSLLALDQIETGLTITGTKAHNLLNTLGLKLYMSGEEEVDLDTAVNYIAAPDVDPVSVGEFLRGCRLLKDVLGRVAFAHRSLQEFFSASAIKAIISEGNFERLTGFLIREPVLSMIAELTRADPAADKQRQLLAGWMQQVLAQPQADFEVGHDSWLTANVFSLMNRLGLSLSQISMSGIRLKGASLRSADIAGSTIASSDMSGVDLANANLNGARFLDTNLQNAFFHNTSAVGAEFVNCDFWNIRWLEEPDALWSARWVVPGRLCAVALSTGHIQLVPLGPEGWMIDEAHNALVHRSGVLEIAVSPAGDSLLASDRVGQLYCYSISPHGGLNSMALMWILPSLHAGNIRRIRFSKDGQSYVTACRDGGVRVFSVDSRLPHRQHFRHQEPVMDADWSPDGRMIASAGYDGRVYLFDLDSEETTLLEPTSMSGRLGVVRAVSFSPSGRVLATGDEEGRLSIWSLDDEGVHFRRMIDLGSQIFALRVVSETALIAGTWAGQIVMTDLEAGGVSLISSLPEVVRSIDLGPGIEILGAAWDGSLAYVKDGSLSAQATIRFPSYSVSDAPTKLFAGASFIRPVGLNRRQTDKLKALGAIVTEVSE